MDLKLDVLPREDGITLIVLHGEISGTETVAQFKEQVDRVVAEGQVRLIMDFRGVSYLNSMGLGVVMAVLRKVKKSNGDLKLMNLSPPVRSLFDLTHLTKVFELYDTEEAAIRSFSL